jgi:hypothetical protein
VRRARACQAFSGHSGKKPIAPRGWKNCYHGPGTRSVAHL